MAEPCVNGKYLVLHFLNGQLASTKVARTWRGALMSKRNHEREYKLWAGRYDAATRILPIKAILALEALDRPSNELDENDLALLKRMGIGL